VAESVYRMWYGLDGPGFESRQGNEAFFFSERPRPAVRPTHPPVQLVQAFSGWSSGRGMRMTTHLFRADVRNEWSYYSTLPVSLRGVGRDNDTFYK